LAALDPARSLPSTLTAALLVPGPRPPWLLASAVPVDGRRPSAEALARPWASAPPSDVQLTSDSGAGSDDGPVAICSRWGYAGSGGLARVLLDISHDNPTGRGRVEPDPRAGRLVLETVPGGDVRWRVVEAGDRVGLMVS